MAPAGGSVLASRYLLLAEIGSGGMGTVYRARDVRTSRLVAVKILHHHLARDPAYLERFRREARIALALDSRHIVQVLDFGHEGESHFLVMEHVEGESLRVLLRRSRALASEDALSIAIQIAKALEEAHSKHVIHRDIKPENIMVAEDGTVRVADFGVAKAEDYRSLTITGALLGTVQYMAPEYLRGQSDAASDIYSLGVVLYEMLAGVPPFEAETPWHVMRLHLEAQPPGLTGHGSLVEPEVEQVVMRCLAKEPAERFPSAFELRRQMEQLLQAMAADMSADRAVVAQVRLARRRTRPLGASVLELVGGPWVALLRAVEAATEVAGRGVVTAVRAARIIATAPARLVGRFWWAIGQAVMLPGLAIASIWRGRRRPAPRVVARAPGRATTAASMKVRLPRVRLDRRITLLTVTVGFLALAGYGAYYAITSQPRSNSRAGGAAPVSVPSRSPFVVPTPALSGKVAFTEPTGGLLVGDMEVGGFPTRLAAGAVTHPSWAPGGDRVAFVSVQGSGPAGTPGDLMVLDVSKGSVTTVVRPSLCEGDTPKVAVIRNPRWWPDGSALLYQEDCPGPTDPRFARRVLKWHTLFGPTGESKDDPIVDLTAFDQLMGEPVNIASFDVSPVDGSVAFELLCRQRNCVRLALLEPGGFRGRARILKQPQADESYGSPAWSPDGSKLAYYYRLGPEWRLRVLDMHSGQDIDLAPVKASTQSPNGYGYWATITWSPDSNYLAYQHLDAIWLVEAKGGAPSRRLGGGLYPAWADRAQPAPPIVPPALIEATATSTPTSTPTVTPTPALVGTPTAYPTNTPAPTSTPRPASTPTPTLAVYPPGR